MLNFFCKKKNKKQLVHSISTNHAQAWETCLFFTLEFRKYILWLFLILQTPCRIPGLNTWLVMFITYSNIIIRRLAQFISTTPGSIKCQHSFLQKDASNRTSPLSILLSEFQLLRKELQLTLNSIDLAHICWL